ncbi:hypothetical protein A3H10_00875 [Candidatus Uhrbacteria bacterium RIFCSPLOWO2_12_FULL_46_10]|uniref:Glycerophosphoryl diester phosphodiesterase membrane domain-containing protein n=1 Tax=Candidatus Uhrbacteria bacterium RIFCSPLOWO2_01_FULL_47_25 TaxID=1802402 RepID=A0A1F7US18_9BACT|nr:MAG: hypothetical protein UX68_C0042G0002 [Parcubacteria group bacterium GW2011_GWA2_46_9]OGL59259.1 MAG: hypothetical protein A2752_01140 [Candidatus Uhrbacteria bacterium RIFCSPHIGHO2_01_FULL_46_23]OGL68496.1 MAG: hypothetical protein A3D60_02675 [Candidatus Uhrbacteria bacterium RIFCSPHIGHO2_02_FULL_47_29]OGL75577.1 MAG: hypothetical protein A3E96_00860 [Candidatus Uhrbacteria bacterium RIFCSPHIGHO2_12_FULL_46_13]OGL81092.1 MAG: hypothetical protein A2936_00625 [Candidatus Uhrbacteria bac
MNKPLYRIILISAWRTTWNHKRLWFWGLFVGLLGNAGEYQFLVTALDRAVLGEVVSGTAKGFWGGPPLSSQTIAGLVNAFSINAFTTFILLLIGLAIIAIAAFFLWLIMVSIIALVKGGAAIADGENMPSLADGVAEGKKYFSPVLVLYVFGRLILWLLFTALVLFGALATKDLLVGLPLFLVAFIIILPALFVVSFTMRYAIMYVVLKKRSLLDALDQAIALVRDNWLITIELAFFLFVINLIVGAALAALVAGFVFPIHLAALTMGQLGLIGWAISLEFLAATFFLIILFSIGSSLGAFQWLAWTLLFRRLHERGPVSKIVRLLGRWVSNRSVRAAGV